MFLPCSSSSGDGKPLREDKVMQGRQESAADMGQMKVTRVEEVWNIRHMYAALSPSRSY